MRHDMQQGLAAAGSLMIPRTVIRLNAFVSGLWPLWLAFGAVLA